MRVLVTGSSGFIGQNLVRHLTDNQVQVIGLDYRPFPTAKIIPGFEQELYRLGSYTKDLSKITARADAIVHLAAESHVDRSISGPKVFVENNVLGTLELFEALIEESQSPRQVVLFSSDEVGACKEEGSFPERGEPFRCGSVYSATKGAQELLAQAYLNTYDLPIVTTRAVNVFGPGQNIEKFIPTVIHHAMEDKPVPIYGSGMQTRQWVHVDHVCSFLNEVVLSTMIPPGSTLHITGTSEIYNLTLAHMILNLMNKPASLLIHVEDRLGHDVRYALGRTEETDRFMMNEKYHANQFPKDLASTIHSYKNYFLGSVK